MNEKIVFVRTHRGEDEIRSRTAHLSKDIKRALLMVDGAASVAQIMKRSSPSLRGMLEDMFMELLKGGFIEDNSKVSSVSKLLQPTQKPAEEELDFTAAQDETVAKQARILAALTEREAAHVQAEKDAVHAREQAARHAQEQAAQAAVQVELAKAKAEAAAEVEARARSALEAKEKLEIELVKLKVHVEAQVRAGLEAEAQAKAARMEAEQEAVCIREEASRAAMEGHAAEREAARVELQFVREKALELDKESGQTKTLAAVVGLNAKNAAVEASVFSELDELIKKEAACDQVDSFPAMERRKAGAAVKGCDSRGGNNGVPLVERRVITVAVVFLDIVGYTKQSDSIQIVVKQQFNQLLMRSLDSLDPQEWIILDTGDGAAIGFVQHPTDAMAMAMRFCAELLAGGHADFRVRIGVNLGPVSLVRDMNGQINMLGDGINSAQRVMSFAGQNQIYVSRAYVDFVSSLSDEYEDLFRYRGALQDKHGREHQVYELLVGELPSDESGPIPSANADAFNFDAFNLEISRPPEPVTLPEPPQEVAPRIKDDAGTRLLASVESYVTGILPESPPKSLPESPAKSLPESPPKSLPESLPETIVFAEALIDIESNSLPERPPENLPESVVPVEAPVKVASRPAMPVEKKPAAAPVAPSDKKAADVRVAVKAAHHTQPWGKWATGLVVLLILALFVVPYVWPMQNYVAGIEQRLSEKLHQPVHIGHLAGQILPAPGLTLSDVSIGRAGQIQAHLVQVNFAFTALFGPIKLIDTVELDGVQVQGVALPEVSAWLQQIAADPVYPIRRVVFSHGQLDADGATFADVDGVLEFDSSGQFSDAHFDAGEHKLALQIRAMPADKLALTLSLHDSALPSLPNWTFDTFKAVGELSRDELRLTSLEGRIRGGMLTGSARINWRRDWRVQGELVAKGMPLQHINKLLAGDVEGSAHFQMQAASLAKLADTANVSGVFSVKKGLINGVDIVETARLYSHENLPGGRTHFDEMSSHFSYANGGYRFDQFKLNDSMVKAAGTLTIAGSTLSGTISANLAMRAGSVALQVGGTTASPSLHVAR